ncbi:hypothetical protein VU08_00335 [Desulfobulbus sp. F5]|nr:hypothetical protein [Desulfobulbus sp. F5]
MSQIVKDILFEIQECRLSGNALTCRTTATNKKDDRDIRIYKHECPWCSNELRSKIFDNLSNEQNVSSIEFANKKSNEEYVDHMLVLEVQTRLDFIFEGINIKANKLALLEFTCGEIESDNEFKVQFRDIPISR